MKRSIFFTFIVAMFGVSLVAKAQNVTFGFLQSPTDPTQITAVAYPDFSATNVNISNATFTFLLPAGTVTDPAVNSQAGSFNNINGVWVVDFFKTSVNDDDINLEGNDVYQAVTSGLLTLDVVTQGTPIELFSFALPSDCAGGDVEVLTNNSSIQVSIFNETLVNFNNTFDAAVSGPMANNIYNGNNPSTFSLPCPLNDTPTANDDITSTPAQTPVNVPVLNNDDFGNNGPSTGQILITVNPGGGIATVNTNSTPDDPTDDTIDYLPNPGFDGVDRLTYQICDADGDCDLAEVAISVQGIAPEPVDLPAIPMSLKILLGVMLLGIGTYATSRVMS